MMVEGRETFPAVFAVLLAEFENTGANVACSVLYRAILYLL
jgi:hypothetical protein